MNNFIKQSPNVHQSITQCASKKMTFLRILGFISASIRLITLLLRHSGEWSSSSVRPATFPKTNFLELALKLCDCVSSRSPTFSGFVQQVIFLWTDLVEVEGPAGCRQRVVLKRLAWMLTVALVLSELFYHSVNWLWQLTNQLPPLIKKWEVQESVTNDGWWFYQMKK